MDTIYLDESELARLVGVAPRTVRRWRERRVGPEYVRLPGRGRVIYDERAVRAWLDARRGLRPEARP